MRIEELLRPTDIVFSLRAAEIGAAAAQLLETILPARGFERPEITRLVAAVAAREREAPTLCGPIAIPHARDSKIESFVVGIGVNREGVIEGQPLPRIAIAFLSPVAERTEHLALLASLARLSRDRQAVDAIATAATPGAVIDTIRSAQR